MELDSIVRRIFDEMEFKNITQSELAKKLNIGQSTVASWKKRNCPPPINYLEKLSEILGVSIEYLVTGSDVPQKYKLDSTEQLLVRMFRTTSEENKELILNLTIKLADETYHDKTNPHILLKTFIDKTTDIEKQNIFLSKLSNLIVHENDKEKK